MKKQEIKKLDKASLKQIKGGKTQAESNVIKAILETSKACARNVGA